MYVVIICGFKIMVVIDNFGLLELWDYSLKNIERVKFDKC